MLIAMLRSTILKVQVENILGPFMLYSFEENRRNIDMNSFVPQNPTDLSNVKNGLEKEDNWG